MADIVSRRAMTPTSIRGSVRDVGGSYCGVAPSEGGAHWRGDGVFSGEGE